jgi:riboflavin kinase/FMN adenylyltransferase
VQVIRSLDACPRPPEGAAITLGFFDGVHLGHQLLIGEARRLAAEQEARSAVVTFDQHPAAVVRPASAPRLLTTLEHRLELLTATGVDHVVVVAFDEARSKESPEDFVEGVLVDCLRTRAVVVGADFHFGHERRGDVALLTAMGRDRGFEVEGVQLLGSGSEGARTVSSTAIRAALVAGDLGAANRMLGRPHEVRGVVVASATHGAPGTGAVLVPATLAVPAGGVYAVLHERPDGTVHPALALVGPTGGGATPTSVEVELLDPVGDLVGEAARIRFVRRLRDRDDEAGAAREPETRTSADRDAARAVLA